METMIVYTIEHARALFETLSHALAESYRNNDRTADERAILCDLIIAAHTTLRTMEANQS